MRQPFVPKKEKICLYWHWISRSEFQRFNVSKGVQRFRVCNNEFRSWKSYIKVIKSFRKLQQFLLGWGTKKCTDWWKCEYCRVGNPKILTWNQNKSDRIRFARRLLFKNLHVNTLVKPEFSLFFIKRTVSEILFLCLSELVNGDRIDPLIWT